jgi:hypothetical protein
MAINPILEIARQTSEVIKPLVDKTLKDFGVSIEKDPKRYYRISRDVLRGIVAAAAQRVMEDGADRALVTQTLYEHAESISNCAWQLFLETHPEVMKKIEMEKGKKDAELVAQASSFKKQNPLKCIPGGLTNPPLVDDDTVQLLKAFSPEVVVPFAAPAGCACGKGEFDENGECTCEVENPEDMASNSDCLGEDCTGCAECKGH